MISILLRSVAYLMFGAVVVSALVLGVCVALDIHHHGAERVRKDGLR